MQTPAELSEELAKSAAYHEAGHAVVAALEGLSVCEAGMHVDSKGDGVAFTFRRNPGDPNNGPADIDQRERSIMMVYAGKIAQEKFASTSALLSGDDAVAEALLNEMYSPPKSEAWNAAQQRLWGGSYLLVSEHWKIIQTLAETLWSKPTVPRTSRRPLRFDSQDSTEKWIDGHEIKAVLGTFQISCDVLPDSGGIGTPLCRNATEVKIGKSATALVQLQRLWCKIRR